MKTSITRLLFVWLGWAAPVALPFAAHAQRGTVVVDTIIIEGNKRTRPAALYKELLIKQGDKIDKTKLTTILEASAECLYNEGYFDIVEITVDTIRNNNHVVLRVKVKERWRWWPNGRFKLEDITHVDWIGSLDFHRISYGMGFQMKNVVGWLDNFHFQVAAGYTYHARIGYSNPFALSTRKRVGLEFYFDFSQNDEVAYGAIEGSIQRFRILRAPLRRTFDGSASLLYRPHPLSRLSCGFRYFRAQIMDTLYQYNPRYLSTTNGVAQYPILSAEADFDKRDIQGFPLSGFRVHALIELCGLPGWGSNLFFRGLATCAVAHPIPYSDFNFQYGLYGAFILGNKVPFFHKFFLGQDISIRGYESFFIDASAILAFKTELKYPIIKRRWTHLNFLPKPLRQFPIGLYPYLYLDGGAVADATFNNGDPTYKNRFLTGLGAGVQLYSFFDNVFRFESGFNADGRLNLQVNFTLAVK